MYKDESKNIETLIEKQLQVLREQENELKNALLIKTRHSLLSNISKSLDLRTLTDAERQMTNVYDITTSTHISENRPSSSVSHNQYNNLKKDLSDELKYELIPSKLKERYELLDSQMHCCNICTGSVIGFDYKTRNHVNHESSKNALTVYYNPKVVDLNSQQKYQTNELNQSKNTTKNVSFNNYLNYTPAEMDAISRPLSSEHEYAWRVRNRHFYQDPILVRSKSHVAKPIPEPPSVDPSKSQFRPFDKKILDTKKSFSVIDSIIESCDGLNTIVSRSKEPWHYGKGAGNTYVYRDYTLAKKKY